LKPEIKPVSDNPFIACMRKMIVAVSTMIKNQEPWRGEMA